MRLILFSALSFVASFALAQALPPTSFEPKPTTPPTYESFSAEPAFDFPVDVTPLGAVAEIWTISQPGKTAISILFVRLPGGSSLYLASGVGFGFRGGIWNPNALTIIDGNDRRIYLGTANSETITAAPGKAAIIFGFNGADIMTSTSLDDLLLGGNGKNTQLGGDGNDQIYSEVDGDLIHGGAGEDVIWAGGGAGSKAFGDDGDDQIHLFSSGVAIGGRGKDKIWGSPGNDTVLGGNDADRINGDSGQDVLKGEFGNDTIQGGADADFMFGGAGNEQIYGQDGDDYIWGDEGDDLLYGESGNDHIAGGDGADYLDGSDGDDALVDTSGASVDRLFGGAGQDTLDAWDDHATNTGNQFDQVMGEAEEDFFFLDDGDLNDIVPGSQEETDAEYQSSSAENPSLWPTHP